ncbi:hypothetical protein B0H19DRAFT_1068230 [Mycena capillaripes]|nr:hypothetical protein B0H19DRAFT_1068230 [Mycena capillaripes]
MSTTQQFDGRMGPKSVHVNAISSRVYARTCRSTWICHLYPVCEAEIQGISGQLFVGASRGLRAWGYLTRYFRHFNNVGVIESNGGVNTFDAAASSKTTSAASSAPPLLKSSPGK